MLKTLSESISHIRQSLTVEDIFQLTATEVRQYLDADRVAVFRFYPEKDWEGEFVSEDVIGDWASVLSERVHDHCFGEQFAPEYQQGRVQAVANIHEAGLSGCHAKILGRFQIKANLIVPVLKNRDLWGLLCIHQCASPRQWQSEEIEFVQHIAEHFRVAIEQSEVVLTAQTQAAELAYKVEQERALAQTISKVRQCLEIDQLFQSVAVEVRQLLHADRVAVFKFYPEQNWEGEFVSEDVDKNWPSAVSQRVYDHCFGEQFSHQYLEGRVQAVHDIYDAKLSKCHVDILGRFQVRANLVVPVLKASQLWGLVCVHQCAEPRQWQPDEIKFVQHIAEHLSVALAQAESMAQVQQQAEALHKATERQKGLSRTVDGIRQSLDIDTIFKATTQETRQLLEVDRVAIYRFTEGWRGAFVADSIVDGWRATALSQPVIEKVLDKPAQDGCYPRNEVFVPISHGDKLWGLLMAYQTSSPRYWESAEVDLLTQVGSQLGIALQQAELLQQTQQQKEQLNQALQQLQGTQAKLVQGEKMAGLGQLMAGIAHEINNPVSFVFSNVAPAQKYIADLLELLSLYQQQYPEPDECIQRKRDESEIDFLAEDLPRLISSMKMGAVRIQKIIKSMQIFSRMDEAACKAVDIHQGIDSTLLILSHRLKAQLHRPEIKVVKVYGELPLLTCYAGQLNQVFMNLLSNAIDALELVASSNKPLQISVITDWIAQNNSIVVQIKDTGSGIPESVISNVFNPFFTTKPVGKGTGLGLSISYQIVTELHRGKLECSSQPNEGTTFRLELPVPA